MAVHLHAMAGACSYFSITGVNPLLLEPLFNDPRLRKTNFVLLHGGWPYVREIGSLLQKPNVYLDISSQDLIVSPHTEARWLREWLEMQPQKVLFGTGAVFIIMQPCRLQPMASWSWNDASFPPSGNSRSIEAVDIELHLPRLQAGYAPRGATRKGRKA